MTTAATLPLSELLALRRWNTPTIYNGLEQYTRADRTTLVNLDEVRDFMPEAGAMVGYAVTLVVEPSDPRHVEANPSGWTDFFRYLAGIDGPKIVVIQDLDQPRTYGATLGEVNGSIYRQLGCVGAIVDGACRDLEELRYSGLKVLAKRLSVSHCHGMPVRWGCPVEACGIPVRPGQLVHADQHGFLAVPEGEEAGLFEAARFMDQNECDHLIAAARYTPGAPSAVAEAVCSAAEAFAAAAAERFGRGGEWR